MNRSYKLLSIFFDKKPIPEILPTIVQLNNFNEIRNYDEAFSLFDLNEYQRKIKGTEVLSCSEYKDFERKCSYLVECEKIIIVLDYYSDMQAANHLYLRRLLQAVCMISKKFPNVNVCLGISQSMAGKYLEILEEIYGSNTTKAV